MSRFLIPSILLTLCSPGFPSSVWGGSPFLLAFATSSFGDLKGDFQRVGYVEMFNQNQTVETFDALYARFEAFLAFLEIHPDWVSTLTKEKECFIRSKERGYYSTDFFGLYQEGKKKEDGPVSFYYSSHFHAFLASRHLELSELPEIADFLNACFEIQKPYGALFESAAAALNLGTLFSSEIQEPPLLLKVAKYPPAYAPLSPHYDGTAFSLFLDSTDNDSLLLSPYHPSFAVDDFSSPLRKFARGDSLLLIPGTFLSEFSIPPTPHIVIGSGKTRYATIAFAMRPHYKSPNNKVAPLPSFKKFPLKERG